MCKKNLLKLEKRKQIYNEIKINPGFHLMELKRRINIPKTTLKYHLDFLEKQDLIIRRIDRRYNRFYIALNVGSDEKKIFNMLRQPVPRNIIFVIFCYLACSTIDIAKELNKHQSTVNYHLKKLIENDIIEPALYKKGFIIRKKGGLIVVRSAGSNEKFYRLKDAGKIQSLLIKYQESLINDPVSDSVLFWSLEYDDYEKKPKIVKQPGHQVDKAISIFYDIFPNPYCV